MATFSRRSLLIAGSAAAALLGALQFTPQKAAAADGSFTLARQAWQAALVGSGYDPEDAAIAARLRALATTAVKWQTSMATGTSRTTLWTDLPLGTKSANLTSTARRLRDMAIGWAAIGSPTYGNDQLRAAIIDGLGWFTSNAYTATTKAYDNWYEWMVSTPQALNDTAVLMFDQLTAAQIGSCVAAQARQVPQMPTTGTQAAAANLALIADGFSGRGVLSDDMPTVTAALESVASLLSYAEPIGGTVGLLNGGNVGAINGGPNEVAFFSHDGFYPDGSFIQHGQFPYVGGYGASFLSSLVATIIRTAALGTALDTSIVYNWIHDAFEPFLWNGLVMDTVRGRNVAFSPAGDHDSGHGILAACLPLLRGATGATRERLAAMLKQELGSDTADDLTASFSLASLTAARALLADGATPARGPLVKTQVFGAMDRVIHRTETFAAALAMNSLRISNYETGNNENLAAWYTADGALYLYTDDLAQFDNGYWFTVDPYRIPGTTVDRVERTRATVPWRAEYHNPDYWAGGVAATTWGAAGLRLTAQPPSSLTCRKSWFFFGDEILCLGDGISTAPGRTAETILENRRATSAAAATITIDGKAVAAVDGSTDIVQGAGWAHLDGVAGYVFPTPAVLNAQRQTRSGKLSDISPNKTSAVMSNTFSTLWLDHTKSATDTYSYIVLPNATVDSTKQYAAQSPIRVLSQTGATHSARHEPSGRWAATFFAAGSVSFVTAAQACAVGIEEQDAEMIVTVSDPTQTSTSVVIDLDIESGDVLSADPGITTTRVNGKTRISADVADAVGASRTVRIRYALTPENVSDRLREMNKSGALAKEPYKRLEDQLKSFQKSLLKSQTAQENLAGLRTTLVELTSQIDPTEFRQIDDLVSRLTARVS
ncbi:polysaccharide lyase 8 family protein [Arthrobacter sp. CJ23]|uniref:polysaccharide lyase 8 family protein n=1 Tax=Arthrobacter sp. CJ23 TaxID=2972479 RepID=UPI00215CA381|nr:polysaccharide lyase 8 family protein [Arthrobacter sp. CJ23]UVJ39484.1 polysaccharide lyase 8 family protein [Arthrobacter sp. CJ23]